MQACIYTDDMVSKAPGRPAWRPSRPRAWPPRARTSPRSSTAAAGHRLRRGFKSLTHGYIYCIHVTCIHAYIDIYIYIYREIYIYIYTHVYLYICICMYSFENTLLISTEPHEQ